MNKILKSFKSIIVILILTLILSSCGNKDTKNNSESAETNNPQISEEQPKKQEVEAEKSKEKEGETEKSETIVLTDNVGREVELPYPVETCVVANRYNSELIRASGAIDRVISVDLNTAQDREYWSEFDPENVIGKGQRELNYEKIAELNPQVLILPANGTYEEAEAKLEPFGIKVFVISGYDTSDFKNQVENIGKMFGTEEQAMKFYDYFNNQLEEIKAKIPVEDRKTVYFESTTKLNSTLPGDYFYDMTIYGGAKNIFATDYENINKAEIDPEEVIKRNPDVIIKLVTPEKALKGTGLYEPPTKEDFVAAYEDIISRPGWDEIKAVKNDEIYFMTQFSHGGASKMVGAMYIANVLYPEQLKDIDANEVFRAWMEDFQGFKNIEGHFYSAKDLK